MNQSDVIASKPSFLRLRFGNILGIVDAYGSVHSVFTGENIEHHSDHFPNQTHCQWRWSFNDSINWFLASQRPTEEQYDAIQRHLSKKYGLRWWNNGHHDIDHILARCKAEKKALEKPL